MLRVLVATWSARAVGGAELYLERLIPLLAGRGCELSFGYETDAPDHRRPIEVGPGIQRFVFPKAADAVDLLPGSRRQPDVLFVHGLLDPALEARLLSLAPAVLFPHDYYGTCISGGKTYTFPVVQPCGREFGLACVGLYYPRRCGGRNPATLVRDFRKQRDRRALLPRYAAVITASEHMRREFVRHGAAERRVFACPLPPTEHERGNPWVARQPNHSASSRFRLLFAARMDALKGGDRLIAALPSVQTAIGRPLLLTMAGDGPARRSWEMLARDVALGNPSVQIDFKGWLERRAVGVLMEAHDVFVVPSLWPEPYGFAGTEAVHRGLPVVAFASGGIPEWLIDGENGCLAPGSPPSAEGLAEALVRCLRRLSEGPAFGMGLRTPSERDHAARVLEILHAAAGAAQTSGAVAR